MSPVATISEDTLTSLVAVKVSLVLAQSPLAQSVRDLLPPMWAALLAMPI